jgi:hypothetical protein
LDKSNQKKTEREKRGEWRVERGERIIINENKRTTLCFIDSYSLISRI